MATKLKDFLAPLGIPEDLKRQILELHEAEVKAGARGFLNLIEPIHGRTSCGDGNRNNGFFSRNSVSWHGRCTRCMYLEVLEKGATPEGFDPDECSG